jgi:hypothetical protein
MAAVTPIADTGQDDGSQLAQALESEEQKAARLARLDALGQALAKSRSEAIQARQLSGVEQDWREDEEFYQGIDDANRGEHRSTWHTKPMGQAMPEGQASTRSTVFPNITGPYVDAAAARIADMLLPTDDKNFAIKPTPIADLVGLAAGEVPDKMQHIAMMEAQGDPALARQKIAEAVEAAAAVIAKAKAKADKAEKRIEDWFIECAYHSQVRLVIEDAARVGTGILKGPIPQKKRGIAYMNGQIEVKEEIKPISKRISYLDFFPSADCGEDIQDGSCTWERDRVTRKQMRELKNQPGYIAENIDLCMEEGPTTANGETSEDSMYQYVQKNTEAHANKFEIWYYHGTIEKLDLEAGGVDCTDIKDAHIPAMLTMVNNRVIRASLNPLDTGSYPYDVMVWRPKANHWSGIGVARQIRTPQRIVVAATRNLMDNAGLAAGPMVVIRQGMITPADGVIGLGPRKVYYLAEDADEAIKATDAIGIIKVDMLVNELMQIIQLGLKLAEDVTGMPLLLQGQQGKSPDTVGGMQILNNNASAVLRRLARLFDDRVTEPHVRRYYEWLLQYGEDEEKGDFFIDARGSSALVERDIQNQELAGLIKVSLDMRFGLDPRKTVQEYLRSRHFDPKRFEFEDEEWKQILQKMSEGPQDAGLQIAQLRATSEERLAKFWGEMERQADEMRMRFEENENALDRMLDAWITEVEQTGASQISLNTLKGKLADTTLKLRAQRDLSKERLSVKGLTPPTEPAGIAPKGEAFQK